jgi:DNA-binding transcriptional LysR family regulator
MERSRRLYELWSWLVPFRVVAETESLQAASEQLHVAPSALSRSVKLLEASLGVELFDRRSQRLALNDAGARLLAATRVAMRGLDDAITDVLGGARATTIRIACPGELLPIVLPCAGALAADLDPVRFVIDELLGGAEAALLRGAVDVAVTASAVEAASIVVRRVATLARAVFAAAVVDGEPAFVVPVDADGAPRERFPPGVARVVALRVHGGAAVLEAVRAGGLAAVLPRAVGRAVGLVELDAGIDLAPLEVSIATRPALTDDDVASRVAARLGEAASAWS